MKAAPDRRPRAAPVAPPRPSRLRAALALLPIVAGLLLLSGVIALGWLALQALRGQDRYQIAFDDIECAPPPNMTREKFLEDVQFIARFPDSAYALDDGLPARLSAAFAQHPWVERVEGVEVAGPRRVRVRLVYRTAVLRVKGSDEERAVDRYGFLLPTAAAEPSLPVLVGDLKQPVGPGRPWGDGRVEGAARTAALLSPYQDRLHLESFESAADGGLTLMGTGGRVMWGRPPGDEALGEPAAEVKLRRLLDFAAKHGDGAWKVDLREKELP